MLPKSGFRSSAAQRSGFQHAARIRAKKALRSERRRGNGRRDQLGTNEKTTSRAFLERPGLSPTRQIKSVKTRRLRTSAGHSGTHALQYKQNEDACKNMQSGWRSAVLLFVTRLRNRRESPVVPSPDVLRGR